MSSFMLHIRQPVVPSSFIVWRNRGSIDGSEVIRRSGATSLRYKVTTREGYILHMRRLVYDSANMKQKPGRGIPVFFLHGTLCSHDFWMSRGKGEDLAFILAEQGFDVFLGDKRGTFFSKNHLNMSSEFDNKEFWSFTNTETSIHDLSAFIDSILEITKKRRVAFIGHSLGCADYLILTSLKPEYNDKILVAILLAPVGYRIPLKQVHGPFIRIMLQISDYLTLLTNANVYELLPRTKFIINFMRTMCEHPSTKYLCLTAVGLTVGEHRSNLDMKEFPNQLSHFSAGMGIFTLHHIAQILRYGFKHYDYGKEENKRIYGSETPPEYPTENVSAPTFYFYGRNDGCTNPKSMKELAKKTPGTVQIKQVPDPKFSHMDFVFGRNTKKVLYDEVVDILTKYAKVVY